MKKCLFILFILLFYVPVFAQVDSTEIEDDEFGEVEWLKGNMNEKHKYGVRFGMSTSTMLGGELSNPRPLFGLNGAVYYRYRYTEKAAFQIEAGFSMRGSRFANAASDYKSIRMYNVDIPLFWVRSLNKDKTTHAIVGAQYTRILEPDIYIGNSSVPDSRTPNLKRDDCLLVAGAQFYAGFVGFQLIAKYGLIDINNGLIPNLSPSFRNKDIRNATFEINLLF